MYGHCTTDAVRAHPCASTCIHTGPRASACLHTGPRWSMDVRWHPCTPVRLRIRPWMSICVHWRPRKPMGLCHCPWSSVEMCGCHLLSVDIFGAPLLSVNARCRSIYPRGFPYEPRISPWMSCVHPWRCQHYIRGGVLQISVAVIKRPRNVHVPQGLTSMDATVLHPNGSVLDIPWGR